MNKYVVRTSFVWIALITCTAGFFVYRARTPKPDRMTTKSVEPIAVGPETNVEADVPRVPIELSPERRQSIGVQTGTAEWKQLVDKIRATGTVDINERTISYVQIRFPGYVRKVFANATYQFVRKGDPLFSIYSPELIATENEYLLALRNEALLGRSRVDGVSTGAAALTNAAEARLRQWDISPHDIGKVKATGKPIADLEIDSPVSGYITERNALPNLYVEPATRLYAIADFSRVWVTAQIFQDDAGRVKPGDAAQITVDSYPGRTFRGRIESILPQMDFATRTVRARLDIANPDLKLKPGMYVNVELQSNLGRQLVVPASAVLESGTRQIVFLDRGDGKLEPKDVVAGAPIDDERVITKGLSVHDRVATSANFLIDSESQLQAAAGSYVPPPPGASAAAAQASPQVNIEFSTDPSPPRKGSNTFHVKLTEANGSPLAGADVSVVFFMPAMPAMGMAAMTTQAILKGTANGEYQGTGALQSGGAWQATISAKKNGQTLATKQLHLNATGGM